MTVTLPPELVADILIKELSSFFTELKAKREALIARTFDDCPTYSSDLDEEFLETTRDYEACKRILTYYGGSSCAAIIS